VVNHRTNGSSTFIPIANKTGKRILFLTKKPRIANWERSLANAHYKPITFTSKKPPPNFVGFLGELFKQKISTISNGHYDDLFDFVSLAKKWEQSQKWSKNKRNLDLNKLYRWYHRVDPGQRLTNTEIHFLYYLWKNKKYYSSLIDPQIHRVTIKLWSKMDVCNTCTLALLQSKVAEILTIDRDNITIQATCWRAGVISDLWARTRQNWQQETKRLCHQQQ